MVMWLFPIPVIFTGTGSFSGGGIACIAGIGPFITIPPMLWSWAIAALHAASTPTARRAAYFIAALYRAHRALRRICRAFCLIGLCASADSTLSRPLDRLNDLLRRHMEAGHRRHL